MVSLPFVSRKTKDELIFGSLAISFLIIVWMLSFVVGARGDSLLSISFYDVGQGDAILISKGETQILVDGGPNDTVLSHLGRDMSPWDRNIELMVLTHPHADHVAGLVSIIERYQVERIVFYPLAHDSGVYHDFLEAIGAESASITEGAVGTRIELSGAVLEVIWPSGEFTDENINNASVVLRVRYGDFDALLLGDAEQEVQAAFLHAVDEVEVLKVAHQGARDGAYMPLLERSSPGIAVISVGAGNQYGHPHDSVLEMLERLGATTLRTDQSGTITIVSDGSDFWYTTEK